MTRPKPGRQDASRTRAAPPGTPARDDDASSAWWEWALALVGVLVVASLLAYLGYRAATASGSPPDIAIVVKETSPLERGYRVAIEATNRGGRTAANVRVRGELRSGATTVEISEMTFDYLPPASSRRGGLFFQRDPGGLEMRVTPLGYENP